MKLFVDGQEVVLGESWDVNMVYKFIDTYSPSAVKTPFSTTVKLPGCKQNSLIFTSLQSRYPFELFTDSGRIVEKGYCTLDNITENNRVTSYNLTLYGGLGDFFYNLQGDSDNPKTLADLNYGFPNEDAGTFITWDEEYVYSTWQQTPSGKADAFRAIPAMVPGDALQKNKTVVPSDNGVFTAEAGSPWQASDGTLGYLVESDPATVYSRQDFRSELMPLGIKYKSIVDACCSPSNNGGYTVNLDPEFFNADNPYYNNLFLVRGLPTEDLGYDPLVGDSKAISSSRVLVGNYQASHTSQQTVTCSLSGSVGPWSSQGYTIVKDANSTVTNTQINFKLEPFVLSGGEIGLRPGGGITLKVGKFIIWVIAVNQDTGELISAQKTYGTAGGYSTSDWTVQDRYFYLEAFEGVLEIPKNWTRFRLGVILNRGDVSDGVAWLLPWAGATAIRNPADIGIDVTLGESMEMVTRYYDPNSSLVNPLKFSKRDLLGNTKSPLYYLLQFTKMFNLRFYQRPGTKTIDLLLSKNYIGVEDPLDIQDKICYDKDYSSTRNLTDVGYYTINLSPNKNQTTELCEDVSGSNFLGREYGIGVESKGKGDYLTVDLKVGCKARVSAPLSVRTGSNYLMGFNQVTPYSVVSISGSQSNPSTETTEISLTWKPGQEAYDFLELENTKDDTIVMYSGLKDVLFSGCPAIITRTSPDMIQFAEGPCFISGLSYPMSSGGRGTFLGCRYISSNKIPSYGLVPQLNSYENGLTYNNVNYSSIIATENIFDKYFREFLDGIYREPLQVECYVRLDKPELRRLYWFDNCYWILSEVSGYNYSDSPCKCKFVRYLG